MPNKTKPPNHLNTAKNKGKKEDRKAKAEVKAGLIHRLSTGLSTVLERGGGLANHSVSTNVSANVSAGNKIREGKSRWISIDVEGGIYLAADRNGGDKGYLYAW